MGQEEEFFCELKDWSARKLNIIKKYVDGFSRILGSRFPKIYYVDGFAGKGVYDDGEPGSPVLAAEASLDFSRRKMPYTLACINVEKDHDNFLNLSAATAKFGALVKNVEGSFEDNLDAILAQTTGNPAVFFLDDFGIKGTGWESVEKVIARQDPADLWVRFDYKTVLRLAGFYGSDAKEASGKVNTLQNLFGISDSEYLQSRLVGAAPDERVRNAIGLYIERLERTFARFRKKGFAASYPIRAIDGQSKYHLVFACSHYKAATLASNIVNGVEENFEREREEHREAETGQISLFSTDVTANEIFQSKVCNLKAALLALSNRGPLKREEIQYELLVHDRNWFGKIGRRHLTQAIRELINELPPRIRCTGTPGSDEATIELLEQAC